jgi:predicted acylesterase/phospholipase RssA
MTKQLEVGVVLQGGGALGAYECGALGALLELMDEAEAAGRSVKLTAVAGVSIGAINAACVVGAANRADAIRRLDALWKDLALQAPPFWPAQAQRDLSLFGLPGFYAPRIDIFGMATWTSYYDTTPLIGTLTRHVDFAALNRSPTAFVVTAVDVENGTLRRFSNRSLDDRPPTEITAEHIKASGSLPPQFPWTVIKDGDEDRRYWDGGLVDNTPLGGAIDAFGPGDVQRVLVVVNLYPLRARLPRNLADVEDRLHELSFGNHMLQDRQAAERINRLIDVIEKLAALVPPDTIDADLLKQVNRAREFKIINIVDIDVQSADAAAAPGRQASSDDGYGLRDFSPETVRRRRDEGYRLARARLSPIIAGASPAASEPARRAS